MFYQVTANLYFENQDEANDFYHDCEKAFAKSTVINPVSPDLEFSHIELIENHHDSDPNEPCKSLASCDNIPPEAA